MDWIGGQDLVDWAEPRLGQVIKLNCVFCVSNDPKLPNDEPVIALQQLR